MLPEVLKTVLCNYMEKCCGLQPKDAAQLHEMLCAWRQAVAMLRAGEITQEEYDRWRYRYPEFDQRWAKVPSQALNDMLVEALKDEGK